MLRHLLIASLVLTVPLEALAAGSAVKEPSAKEFLESAPLPGSEADSIVETAVVQGTEKDEILKPEILEGDDSMARYENQLPKGATLMDPGDVVAPEGERPGFKVVPGSDGTVPGGTEPGEYDGTKDTGPAIWKLETFLKGGGQKFRFLGDRVFKAEVKAVKHLQVRWAWGQQTTESIAHVARYRRVQRGTEIKKLKIGAQVIRKFAGHRMVQKVRMDAEGQPTDDGDGSDAVASMVRCPVYRQVVCPVVQRFRVPVYRYEEVAVRKTERKSVLSWIKRYRSCLGTFTVWTNVGGFDEWVQQYPKLAAAAKTARAVTERVLAERQELLKDVRKPPLESYLRTDKPTEAPKAEFLLDEKRKSVRPATTEFVEDNVPDAELVAVPPAK